MFTRGDRLVAHARVHTGVKAFTCHLCANSYSRKNRLNVHYMEAHGQARPEQFVCALCDAVFAHPRVLKKHMRVRHVGAVPAPPSTGLTAHLQQLSDADKRDGESSADEESEAV